jgi:hypothetical protein
MKHFFIFTTVMAIAAVQLHGQNRTLPKFEVSVNAGGGISSLNYKLVDPTIDATLNLGLAGNAGLGLHFFFSNHIGLATGLEAALYNAKFTAPLSESPNNLIEKQNLIALQMPLMLKIMAPLGQQKNTHFYFGLGGRAGYSLMGNFNQTDGVDRKSVV